MEVPPESIITEPTVLEANGFEPKGLLSNHWRTNGLGCLAEIKEEQEQSSPTLTCEERKAGVVVVQSKGGDGGSGVLSSKVSPRPPSLPSGTITVKIVSARGLRSADWVPGTGSSDPYCICEIPGKPNSKFQTLVVENSLEPVWGREEELEDYAAGDCILFTIYDQDFNGKHDLLGQVVLDSPSFHPDGFEGELPLANAGRGVEAFLHIKISAAPDAPPVIQLGAVVEEMLQTPCRMQQHLASLEAALGGLGGATTNGFHVAAEDVPSEQLQQDLEEFEDWQTTSAVELQKARRAAQEKEERLQQLQQQLLQGESVQQGLMSQVRRLQERLAGSESVREGQSGEDAVGGQLQSQLLEELQRQLASQAHASIELMEQQEQSASLLEEERAQKSEAEENAARQAKLVTELQQQQERALDSRLTDLQSQLQEEQGRRSQAEQRALGAESLVQDLRRSIASLTEQLAKVEQEQQAASRASAQEEAENVVTQLEKQLGEERAKLEDMRQLAEAFSEKDQEIADLTQDLEEERRERNLADQRFVELDKMVQEMQGQLEDNRHMNVETDMFAVKMEQQLTLLSKQLESERRDKEAAEKQAGRAEATIQELQDQLSDELGKRQEAQRGLATAIDQQVSTLTRQLHEQAATSEGRLEALQGRLQEETAKSCELGQSLEDLMAERERLLKQASETKSSRQALQQQLQEETTRRCELQKVLDGMVAEREQLLRQIGDGKAAAEEALECRRQVQELRMQLDEEMCSRKQAVEEAVRQGVQQLFAGAQRMDGPSPREGRASEPVFPSPLPSAVELQAARTEAHITELQRQLSVELSERMALKAMVAKQEEQLKNLQTRFAERGKTPGIEAWKSAPPEGGSLLSGGSKARRLAPPRELSRPRTGEEPISNSGGWESRPFLVMPPSGPGLPSRAGVTPRGAMSSSVPVGSTVNTPPMCQVPQHLQLASRPINLSMGSSSHPRLAPPPPMPTSVPVALAHASATAAAPTRSPVRSHSPLLSRQRLAGPPGSGPCLSGPPGSGPCGTGTCVAAQLSTPMPATAVLTPSHRPGGASTPAAPGPQHSVAASPARCRPPGGLAAGPHLGAAASAPAPARATG